MSHPTTAAVDPPPDAADGAQTIRIERTRAFLLTHFGLCGIGLLANAIEIVFGLGQDDLRHIISGSVIAVGTLITIIAWQLWRMRIGLSFLIPGLLMLDTVIIMAQSFQEASMETAWVATPIMLIFMLPIFSDRPRLVWVIAGMQIGLFYLMLYLRAAEILPYQLRTDDIVHDLDFGMFNWLGFTVVVVGSALLAGRTSVDVLNSQRQLDEALKRQEIELARANARIVQQQKLLSVEQLTAGIMHEINNPLTFVRTNLGSLTRDMADLTELLEMYRRYDDRIRDDDPELADEIEDLREDLCLDDPDSALKELLDDARDGVDRVQGIIRDLRVFSRLDEAERKPVELREGIESTLKITRSRFDEKEVQLELACGDLPEIEVFPALFNQVVMNLVQNALDATGPNGRVRISTEETADGQQVIVEDDGPGVPPEILSQIFDPFFTTKTVGEGTGLGLSLSMDIAIKHGGRLEAGRSEDLGGARFTFFVPPANRSSSGGAGVADPVEAGS